MSEKNGDSPAYPRKCINDCDHAHESCKGLTKREWFAGMAMQGLISNGYGTTIESVEDSGRKVNINLSWLSETSYKLANAMLKEGE